MLNPNFRFCLKKPIIKKLDFLIGFICCYFIFDMCVSENDKEQLHSFLNCPFESQIAAKINSFYIQIHLHMDKL